MDKLTQAAVAFDNGRNNFNSFDEKYLNALDFKKAVKRTFNLVLTPQELAA